MLRLDPSYPPVWRTDSTIQFGAVGDAALQLAEEALLPGVRIVEDHDRLGAELDRRVGPPHRGIRGVESQHAPDPVGSPGSATGIHRPRGAFCAGTAWGGAGDPTPIRRLHGPVVVGRAALAVVARSVGLGGGIGCLVRGRAAGLLAREEARQGVVHLIAHRLLAAGASLQAGDERCGIVDVGRARHEVGVVPQRVARGRAHGIRHGAPHRGGLAHAARADLEADERAEGPLGGTADGAATANGLRDALCRGESGGRVFRDDLDPALDGCEEVLQTREGGLLGLGAGRQQRAALDRATELLGLGRVEARREIFEGVRIDVHAARDALWDYPDLMPSATDIDDPAVLVARLEARARGEEPVRDEMDDALARLLAGEEPGGSDSDEASDPPSESDGSDDEDESGAPDDHRPV